MSFCQTAITRVIGMFSRIAADLRVLIKLKRCSTQKVAECDLNQIKAVLDARVSLFDFSSVQTLKTCVDKIADCNTIRLNNTMKSCQVHRITSSLVCEIHCQQFDKDQLRLLRGRLPPESTAFDAILT